MIEDAETGVAGSGDGDATGPRVEKSAEVAPAVVGVMAALKEARDWFAEAQYLDPPPIARGLGADDMMDRCNRAIAALEAMLTPAEDPGPKPKPPPSPSALFRMGYYHGADAGIYSTIPEDKRAEVWGEKPAPPATWEDSWALVRAQIAAAR